MRLQLDDNIVEALINGLGSDRLIVVTDKESGKHTPMTGRMIQAKLMEQSALANESRTKLAPYVTAAKTWHHEDGTLEFDDNDVTVSIADPDDGEKPLGAYVMGWTWVTRSDFIRASYPVGSPCPDDECPGSIEEIGQCSHCHDGFVEVLMEMEEDDDGTDQEPDKT